MDLILRWIMVFFTTPSSVEFIEENQRCFRLGSYFMAVFWAAASYSRGGFSLFRAGSARRVIVPGGSTFHLESETREPILYLLVPDVLDACRKS